MAIIRPSPAIKINGGDAGVVQQLEANTIYTATLADITGVSQTDWTVSRTDDTTLPSTITSDGDWQQSGSVGQTIQFQTLGLGTAGCLQATVENGVDPITGQVGSQLMTAECKWYVPTASGLQVCVSGEQVDGDNVSSATHGMIAPLNAALRGNVPVLSTTPGSAHYTLSQTTLTGGTGAQTVFSFQPTQDGQFTIYAQLFAKDTASDRGNYHVAGSYKRIGGTVSAIVASDILLEHENDSTWAAAFVEVTPTVQLQVTPDATLDTTVEGLIYVVGRF